MPGVPAEEGGTVNRGGEGQKQAEAGGRHARAKRIGQHAVKGQKGAQTPKGSRRERGQGGGSKPP